MAVYKDKNKKTWYVRCRLKRNDGTSKEMTKRGFKTKSDAQQWEQLAKLNKVDSFGIVTFRELALHYLAELKTRVANSTYNDSKRIIDTYFFPEFENWNIHTIKARNVKDWQTKMKQYDYAPKTYGNWHAILHAVFKHGMFHFDLASNPVYIAGPFQLPKQEAKKIVYWTHEEYLTFYNNIKVGHKTSENDVIFWQTVFNLFYYSGVRPGELCCLRWSDLTNNKLSINKTLTRVDNKQVVGETTKGRETRIISLPKSIVNQLLEFKEIVKEQLPRFTDDFFMFGDRDKWLPNTTLRSRLKIHTPKDIPRISLHGIRHSHVSYTAHLGIDIEQISKRLGHADSRITRKIYLHLYPRDQDKIADILENNM